MGLQKYRSDVTKCGENDTILHYANWIGGLSLSKVGNCPINFGDGSRRMVYVRGEAETFFSFPAACKYKGKTIKGSLVVEDGKWLFRIRTSEKSKL